MRNAPETVTLKGGFVIALDVLRLLWSLEARGVGIVRAENGVEPERLRPSSVVRAADRVAVAQHQADLRRVLDYVDALRAADLDIEADDIEPLTDAACVVHVTPEQASPQHSPRARADATCTNVAGRRA